MEKTMDNTKKNLGKILLAVFMAVSTFGVAQAQANFPNKPMRLIVPLSAGGGGDIVARQLAAGVSEILGQPMIVDNKPGGSTIIGTAEAVKSAPDGYVLVMATSSHVINPSVRQLPFDAVTAFEGVSLIATTPAMLVVASDFPANTVQEVIALSKSKPGELTFGSSGIASSPHLSGELFNMMADTDIRHVPYKGMGPALNDLVGGHVTMVFASPVSAIPLVKAGRLKSIAASSQKRSTAFPDLPTIGETLPGYQSQIFYVILAPKGTPQPILEKLNQAFTQVASAPEFADKIIATGGEVVVGTPADALAFIADEVARYKDLIEKAKIEVK